MKCENAKELFSRYMENELDGSQRTAFEEHLAQCPQCEAKYDRFHAAVMLLEELPEAETPPAFHAAVMSRVEQARRAVPRRVRWWDLDWQRVFTVRVPAKAVATAAAVLLVMALLVQLTPLNNIVAGLIPGHRAVDDVKIAQDIEAPPGPRPALTNPPNEGRHLRANSGLSINVSADSRSAERSVYVLRLESRSVDSIRYEVYLVPGGPLSDTASLGKEDLVDAGSLAGYQAVSVPVVVTHADQKRAVVAKVVWTHSDRQYKEYVFMPSSFDSDAQTRSAALSLRDVSIYNAMSRIAADYGVVILAPSNLGEEMISLDVKSGTAEAAMDSAVAQVGLNWRPLSSSIYVVESKR